MTNTTYKLVKVTPKQIIHGKHFMLGYKHAMNNECFDSQYDHWSPNDQWEYERGRQYAKLSNGQFPPKNGKAVNPLAMKLLALACHNRIIL